MRAVRVESWSAAPALREIPSPARRSGESLVRVHAATVGHLDRTIWSGAFLQPPKLPYTPGVEGAGVVIDSDSYRVGARVWIRGGGLGVSRDGTWAEHVAAPDSALGLLPDEISMNTGAAFFSPCTSAWVALHEVAAVRPLEQVLVTGASGAVGSIAVQLAHEAGAEVCEDAAAAGPFDVVIDTVGGAVLEECLSKVRSGARIVAVGYLAGSDVTLDLASFIQCNAALLPLNMIAMEQTGRSAVPALLQQLADGRLELTTTNFAIEEAASALHWLTQRGRRGRAVLRLAESDVTS